MESTADIYIRLNQRLHRNREGKERWLRLRRAALTGFVLPDPRNQEQHDLGIELVWRQRVARHWLEVLNKETAQCP